MRQAIWGQRRDLHTRNTVWGVWPSVLEINWDAREAAELCCGSSWVCDPGFITLVQGWRLVPCQHQRCSNMPCFMGSHESAVCYWSADPFCIFSQCVVRLDCCEPSLDLPGPLGPGGVQWWCAAWTSRGCGRLYGACLNSTSASLPRLCMGRCLNFKGDGTSKLCIHVQACRYEAWQREPTVGRAAWGRGGTFTSCVWGTVLKHSGGEPNAGDQWKADCLGTDSNLVDSASSHTLVSKIKPCMSKYNHYTGKLRTAHYISYCFFDSPLLLGYL